MIESRELLIEIEQEDIEKAQRSLGAAWEINLRTAIAGIPPKGASAIRQDTRRNVFGGWASVLSWCGPPIGPEKRWPEFPFSVRYSHPFNNLPSILEDYIRCKPKAGK